MDQPIQLEQLLARSAQRDQQAFETLYHRTAPRLYAVCLRLCGRRDWAEDILQEAYVKIWHRADSYHAGRGAVLTWMTSITRYTGIDLMRSRRRDSQSLGEEALDGLAAPNHTHPEHFALEGPGLDNCLGELATQQRDSLLLCFYLGLTHEEVSRRLEHPLGTVKSWIRRGLQSLKRCLQS